MDAVGAVLAGRRAGTQLTATRTRITQAVPQAATAADTRPEAEQHRGERVTQAAGERAGARTGRGPAGTVFSP